MKKRLFAMLLVVAMVVGMLPVHVFAAADSSTTIPFHATNLEAVTGLKVEGAEVVSHSEWVQGNNYLEQTIDIYVSEADKNNTVTLSLETAEGSAVSGPLVDAPATVTLVDGEGSYTAQRVAVGSGVWAKMLWLYINFHVTEGSSGSEGEDNGPAASAGIIEIGMKLGEWYDLDLSQYFTDTDGDALTYYVSDDGEAWKTTAANYAYYPAGDGEQKAYFKAVDEAGNESQILTLIASVEEAPSKVTVKISITDGDADFCAAEETDTVMLPTEMTVPYFDLALYGLEGYYYNPRCYSTHKEGDTEYENGQLAGTKETAEGVVTVLHAFIYATELYYLGYDASSAGTGVSYASGEFQKALSWTGGVGSSYLNFWDHGTNLNYYIDWAYPVGAPGWGATSDQIALYGGEDIAIHLIESSSAHGSDFAFFTLDGAYAAKSQADEVTVTQGDQLVLTAVKTVPNYDKFTTEYEAFDGMTVYYTSQDNLSGALSDWTTAENLVTDENGIVALDTSALTAGVYYVAAEGVYDSVSGTETGPAVIELTVEPVAADPVITLTQGDASVTAVDTGVDYEGVNVYLAEMPGYGAVTLTDDGMSDYLGGTMRYFVLDGSSSTTQYRFAIPISAGNFTTKEAIEAKYGKIDGLDDKDRMYQSFPVRYNNSKGDMLYVLIIEHTIKPVESVTLDQTAVSMAGGEKVQLIATVTPEDATFPTVTWTSSNTDVAEVSSDGTVSAWLEGEAEITATADGVSASCTVTVTSSYHKPTVIYSGNNWPVSYSGYIGKITAYDVGVEEIYVNGSNYYITLNNDTAAEAIASLEIVVSGSRGTWVKVNDKILNEESCAPATYTESIQLVDGAAIVKIGASAYWNAVTSNGYSYKNFYFNATGKFDVAPMLAGGSSTTLLVAQNDTYELDLAPLFKNISANEMTYKVSVDGAEAVSADEAYQYVCEANGKHTLVFTANNTIGDSPAYTVTLTVLPTESIYMMNRETANGGIRFFAFTDANGNALPEGTTIEFDEATRTFTITQPTDIVLNSQVITYYMPIGATSFFSGSNQTAGASGWGTQIRKQHTSTLFNGSVSTSIYFYDRKPTSYADNPYETYYFNYKRILPETAFEYIVDGNATYTIYGDVGGVVGHCWVSSGEVHVALTEDTPDDAVLVATGGRMVQLVDGAGEVKWSTGSSFWGDLKNWSIKYKKDQFPLRAEGVPAETAVTVPCLEAYELDLAPLFTDPDEDDTLTYQVKIGNGAWTDIDGSTYSYTPETAQDYVLTFRAYDGFVYTADTYTVNLSATNAATTYDVTVNVDADDVKFYCYASAGDEAYDVAGDECVAEKTDSGYTVAVPDNVKRIVIKIGEAQISADVSKDNEPNVIDIVKTTFELQTAAGTAAEGTVAVTCSDGTKAKGNGLEFYLVTGSGYTFAATPSADFSSDWVAVTLADQTVENAATVTMQFDVKSAKTITIDEGAEVTVYYQRRYYVMDEVKPVLTADNGDGTITYTYSCPKANAYSCGYVYFATNGDLIDKAGYMMGADAYTITWEGEERTGSYRGEYVPGVGQGSRGDDSVLVNVNSQMHLILEQGETFRLRSFRIWEIINTDTENVMIEPQFTYTGYDEDIISMKSANEVLVGQMCGTGGNNWMDITVEGAGVTFLEVGYEAIHLVNGYEAGAWGGAGSANSDDTFNAIDPARTALIVVQTDGNAATDVTFGIDCLSSNVDGEYYDTAKAVAWDAEFDTLYFIGECGQMTLAPSAASGRVAAVDISSDKGETWGSLNADENGVYTADIYSGNNIIRVTKDDGTTAYQVVRGDKITYDITLVTDADEDGVVGAGDTVRVTLNGLHNPVGKMSGIYNPGFGQGQRVTYTWNGAQTRQSGYYQYDFVSNAWIEVTIPEDAEGEYALTDGYINFNVFGDGPGNHRNLTDSGRDVNTSASSCKYTRSLLPKIVVYGHTHSYEAVVTAPTCTEGGYTTYTCECGDSYVADYTDALGHIFQDGECSRCGVTGGWSGDLTWTLSEGGTLTFYGTGKMRAYSYKAETPWYDYREQVTSVVLPDGITRISAYAFYGMTNLVSINIPEGVTEICEYAFKNCVSLTSVTLPESLETIGASALYGIGVTQIVIPAGVSGIGEYSFARCYSLNEITFEGEAPAIGEGAFNKITATIYTSGWDEAVKQSYGGTITWEEK